MTVAIWDTYVQKKDGSTMHFDIIVPINITNKDEIYEMGKKYLESKGQGGQPLTSKECNYCHQEIAPGYIVKSIEEKGYCILEMKGCD
jgi:hypothetical protein